MQNLTNFIKKEIIRNEIVCIKRDTLFISEIESGSTKFSTFVETLGSYMTDQDVGTREKGVTVLSSVMSQLSKDHLNESELHYITMFYCNRIKDHYNIIPSVLNGILAIVSI